MIRLFELAAANGALFSPSCWRSRLALLSLGVEFESVPVGFTQIGAIAPGIARSVPVMIDGDQVLADSWDIAVHLHQQHDPDAVLFGGSQALTHAFQQWVNHELLARIIRMIVADIHQHLRPEDQDYFDASRQRRIGQPLEAVQANRDDRLPALRIALDPVRNHLKNNPWISGEQPAYADFVFLGAIQWSRTMSPYTLLANDDPIHAYLNKADQLYNKSLSTQPRHW